jgi:prepilin-type N-terminal cleavage/methylation domain-containing protein
MKYKTTQTLNKAAHRAFTLVEVMAALLLLSIVAPVFVEAMMTCSQAGSMAEHKRNAIQLAEMQLRTSIVDDSWRDGDMTGDFGTDWPDYAWQLTTEDWQITTSEGTKTSNMTLMTITVVYKIAGAEHDVSLQTLVPSAEDTTSSSSSSSTSSSSKTSS